MSLLWAKHGAACRWGRHFLCLCKESNQRKHTPGDPPAASGGCAVPPGIFVQGILPCTKTAHILVRRPSWVDPPGLPDLKGAPEEQKQQQSCPPRSGTALAIALLLPLLFQLLGPHLGAARGPGKTRRAPSWMTAFSYGTRMCLTKIPGPIANPALRAGRAAWGVFLLLTFLCTSKEK